MSSIVAREQRRKNEKPCVSDLKAIAEVIQSQFLINLDLESFRELDSYDDCNFTAFDNNGNKYVVKVHNGIDSIDFISAQTEAMDLVRNAGLRAPLPLKCIDGKPYSSVTLPSLHEGKDSIDHCLRLFHWIEGKMFSDIPLSNSSLYKYGQFAADVSLSLSYLKNPSIQRESVWDMKHYELLSHFDFSLSKEEKRLVDMCTEYFQSKVLPCAHLLRVRPIHNDMNSYNFLVSPLSQNTDDMDLSILDFGELIESWLVVEIALLIMYIIIDAVPMNLPPYDQLTIEEKGNLHSQIFFPIQPILNGFTSRIELSKEEYEVLPWLVLGRIAQSVTMGKYSFYLNPKNTYLLSTNGRGVLAMRAILEGIGEERWIKEFQTHKINAQ